MTTPRQIALNLMPAVLLALCVLPAAPIAAAAPAADAQAQAREVLAAPHGDAAAGDVRFHVGVGGKPGDAGQAARSLILGGVPREEARANVLTLQARLTLRVGRTGRQDAQAQARRLIHG
jgi:hypothetical protein